MFLYRKPPSSKASSTKSNEVQSFGSASKIKVKLLSLFVSILVHLGKVEIL